MSDADKTVFISYRRDVSSFIARAVFMDLRANGYDVFMDVESIDSGTFDRVILNQIAARAHFVLILTPGSLERCPEPGDWLRREIETAMDLERNIVPLLANSFSFKGAEHHLAGKLGQLPRYNALNVPHDYFDAAMERLRTRFLRQPVAGVIVPAPTADQPKVQQKIEVAASQPAPSLDELKSEQYFLQGDTKRRASDYAGAIADYDEAIRLNPRYTAAYYHRGLAHDAEGDIDRAIDDYTRALDLNPGYLAVYSSRGFARAKMGDIDGAIADRDQAMQLDQRQYAKAHLGEANSYYQDRKFDKALTFYNKVLEFDSNSEEALTGRGKALRQIGKFGEAIAAFDKLIALKPEQYTAYNMRASVRYHQGDFEGAVTDYNRALRLAPRRATLYSNRAEAYFALGQYHLALADCQKAHSIDPSSSFALAGLAISHHALGEMKEAQFFWKVLLTLDANYGDADWVKEQLNWAEPLAEAARQLIAGLDT